MKFDDYLKEQLKDKEFEKEWEEFQPELQLMKQVIIDYHNQK